MNLVLFGLGKVVRRSSSGEPEVALAKLVFFGCPKVLDAEGGGPGQYLFVVWWFIFG